MQHRANGRIAQRGQAMVFATVIMVVILLALLSMYSVGQLTTQKMKLQNTADAVAYSAAVVQARDLNFASYMNRAMIANQVAVGQMVSMAGWVRNADDTFNGPYSSIGRTLASFSPMAFMWNTPVNVMGKVAKQARSALDSALPLAVKVVDGLIKGFSLASKVYHLATTVTIFETVNEVKSANDPDAAFSTAGIVTATATTLQHVNFASSLDPTTNKDGPQRFAKVVDASSDLFYKNRTLPSPVRLTPSLLDFARLGMFGFGPVVMLQFHSGGSTMRSNNMKSFVSADATGMFVIMCLTIPILGIPLPILIPLPPLPNGAGAAGAGNFPKNVLTTVGSGYVEHRNAMNDGGDSWAAVDYGAAYFNPMTAIPYWIKAAQGPGATMDANGGLQSYMDIKANVSGAAANQATTSANQNDAGPAFMIEVERESSSISTSSSDKFKIGGGSTGQLAFEDTAISKKLRAMSSAQAYFSRPKSLFPRMAESSADGRTEYGSLYSPYWQARLLPSGIVQQAASIGSQMAGL